MSMLDYGFIQRVNGVFVNKDDILWSEDKCDLRCGKGLKIKFDKYYCMIYDKEFTSRHNNSLGLIDRFYLENEEEETIRVYKDAVIIVRHLDKEPNGRYYVTWEYDNNKYEVIFGYGIDTEEETWEVIKDDGYNFTEQEIKIIDSWFYEETQNEDRGEKTYTNSELWKLAEKYKLIRYSIYEDQEGNRIIFTGKSFQSYLPMTNKYIGMCVGDKWKFIGIEH